MLRGMYTSISSMITLQARQSVVNNNIANINTTGYKSEELLTKTFDDYLIVNHDDYKDGVGHRNEVGELSFGVSIDDTFTEYSQGTLYETDNNTDFAIVGDGFFRVIDENDNEFFTRDGSFRVDEQGYLTTSTGYLVTGTNIQTGELGPIYVGNDRISLNQANELTAGGQEYKLNLYNFEDNQNLEKVSNNLYSGEGAAEVLNSQIKQSHLEGSNVDYINQTALLMETVKEFEANQKVIQTIDSTLQKIANEIGRI